MISGTGQHEVRLRRFERRELEIAQARSVVVVLEDTDAPAEGRGTVIVQPTFTLRNLSNNVISDVLVEVRPRNDDSGMLRVGADYLAASEHIRMVWRDPPPMPWLDHLSQPDLFDTRVSFTDAAGLRWERRGRRQPTGLWSHKHSDLMPPIVPSDAEPPAPL